VCFLVAVWSAGLFIVINSETDQFAIWGNKIIYTGAVFIPVVFYNFLVSFLELDSRRKILLKFGYFLSAIFLFFNYFSKLFIAGVPPIAGFKHWLKGGPIYTVFSIYFLLVMLVIIAEVLISYRKIDKGIKRSQLNYIIWSALVGFTGAATNFFPQFFNVYPFGNYLVILYIYFISYAIFKHKLFNIKVIATQLLTFAIWIALFVQIFLAENLQARVTQGVILCAMIFFGILLIRSVQKEVENREEKEEMAKELLLANIHLKELDKAKSDFISIASHQLRAPTTYIKGSASMILEGSYGPITKRLKDPLEKIFESSRRLVLTIGDFLDVSKIESGNMQYDFVKFDIKEMVQSVTDEFKNALTNNGASARDKISKVKKDIKFSLEIAEESDYNVTADQNKIRQVLTNLIDNSIKYTPSGFVKISLQKDMNGRTVLIKIKDSGIGMTEATIDKLFQKFIRAEGISKMHTDGSGLGLFVGREVIRAHGGSIWAESEGLGKGSTFCVRLPVDKIVTETKPSPVNILSGLGFTSKENVNTDAEKNLAVKNVESFIKKL